MITPSDLLAMCGVRVYRDRDSGLRVQNSKFSFIFVLFVVNIRGPVCLGSGDLVLYMI